MRNYLIILLLLISTNLFGQDSFQQELFSTYVVLKYRNEIDLSEKQVTNVKKIYDDHISKFNSIKWDLDAELQSLSKVLKANKVDTDVAMKKMDEIITLENKLKRIRLKMLINIKNQLTASQQEKLKTLRTEDDVKSLNLTTSINEYQKINITIGGDKVSKTQPLFVIIDKSGKETILKRKQLKKDLDPSDIETITVYKGKKAKQLYGEKGKNGVIVIKTKK